jgi:hypothetical protein
MTLLDADEEQQLIAAVGERVQRLGKHRAGAGDGRGHALAARDHRVDHQRLDNFARRTGHALPT